MVMQGLAEAKKNRAVIMVDRETHAILKEEAEKNGLTMATVIRLLVRKLRAGKVVIV
jgi:hypothetical protein